MRSGSSPPQARRRDAPCAAIYGLLQGAQPDGIRSEIDRLRAARFISAREAEAVNARSIERLFASP